jgi:arylsulfatase A-like enzyme
MRGLKSSPYEGGHRVPCFIHWPEGGLNKGKDINELSAHIDILPTLMEICKLKASTSWKGDGMSLFSLLKGDTTKFSKRTIVVDSQRKTNPDKWRLSSVMQKTFRLINGSELYDLSVDPGQKTDISST